MRKTSVYLSDDDTSRLQRIAEREGRSKADVIRAALSAYETRSAPDRRFKVFGAGRGDGRSVADIPDEELLRGFGE